MCWTSSAREAGYNQSGDQGEFSWHSNCLSIARQDCVLDAELYLVELESQAAFVGRLEDLPSFLPNLHASTLVSSDATTSSAVRISRDRAYDLSRRTAHWLHGSRLELPGANSVPNSQSINHAPMSSYPRDSVVEPIRLQSFAPYCGLEEPHEFVEPNNKWVSSASPSFPPRHYPRVSRAMWVSTSSRERQGATAEQKKLLWQNNDPRQGTKSSGDHANSMQYDWMRGLISDGMLDFEDHSVVDQEISHLSRAISKNAVNENLSVLANEVAPSQAVVASTAMTKPTHKPKTPNADLTHTVGTGRLATSRVRKALPRKKRRQELAVTQNSGQCFKCKFVGNSCFRLFMGGMCDRCLAVQLPASQICFKPDLSDCGFFRNESCLHPEPLRTEFDWITSVTMTLEIRMAPSHQCEPLRLASEPLRLACRQFRPKNNDITAKLVRGSVPGEMVEVPTYAAVDPRALQVELGKLARQYGYIFLHELAESGPSEIVKRTFQEAFRYAAKNPQSLVSKALDLWTGSKLCQFERSFDGSETLGLEAVSDPASPMYTKIPIPPVLDYQCDTVIIQWMKDRGSKLIALLCNKVCEKKRGDWFEVFLTGYILINNIEYVYGIQSKIVQMYSITTDELSSRTQRVSQRMMEQWRWSARHLLDICKPLVTSVLAFTSKYVQSATDIASLDPLQVDYLGFLTKSKEAIIAGRRSVAEVGNYNYEMVWGGELLEAMCFEFGR